VVEHNKFGKLIASVSDDNIMFETDFPHPTCLYSDLLAKAEAKVRDLSTGVQHKILGENAANLYGL
jgi:predicted TIM-barrel fold metal-dependent hydrolase